MAYDGLIVGVGNPGAKYTKTRHNFGFMVADRLIEFWSREPGVSCSVRNVRLNADLWDVCQGVSGGSWLVCKPLTFMNLSGQVVGELSRKHGIAPDRILVMHDELDLGLGTVRFKYAGGLAGHNGLKSIAAHLGTKDFARLRLGIGRPDDGSAMADYVLRSFLPSEWDRVGQSVDTAFAAVLDWCRVGLEAATSNLHSR